MDEDVEQRFAQPVGGGADAWEMSGRRACGRADVRRRRASARARPMRPCARGAIGRAAAAAARGERCARLGLGPLRRRGLGLKRSTSTRRPLRSVRRSARGCPRAFGARRVAAAAAEFALQFFAGSMLGGAAPGMRGGGDFGRRGFSSARLFALRFGAIAAMRPGRSRRCAGGSRRCEELAPFRRRFEVVVPRRRRRGKIRAGRRDHPLAELFAQDPRAHFLDCAFAEIAELKRAERDADEPM